MGGGEVRVEAAPGAVPSAVLPRLRPLAWCPPDPLPPPGLPPEPGEGERSPPTLLLLDQRDRRLQEAITGLEALLDPQEQARLQRFRLLEDRQRHLLGRAALRLALAAWLGRDPAALRFRHGPHGKPELADDDPAVPGFNLAHSGALILLGLHPVRPVGVDVERRRPDLDWHPIARRTLAATELEVLEALPAAEQTDAFLRAWCRLEARLKASGDGFAGLARLRSEPQPPLPGAAQLWDVEVPPDHAAAVVLGEEAA